MTDTAASAPPVPMSSPTPSTSPPVPRPVEPSRAVAPVPVRGQRVRRVIRRVEPMSVLRVSAVFYACVFVVLLVAGVVLWLVASAAGIVGNVETFIGDLFALDDFHFEAWQILRATFVGGVVLVLLGTAANVIAVVLFNLIADLVGGVEVTVVDDDVPGPRSVV